MPLSPTIPLSLLAFSVGFSCAASAQDLKSARFSDLVTCYNEAAFLNGSALIAEHGMVI